MSLQERIKPTCHFLRKQLSEKKLVVFLKRGGPRIFLEGHSKNVAPNIEILRESGMPQSCISLLLVHYPSSLIRKPENFGKVVDEVKQMGFHMEKTISVAAIKALCSSNSKSIWNRNSEVYKRWGWSENDVLSAFKRFPQCMTTSEKKIMQVMEFLVNKMEWPAGVINKYPIIVLLSLEKRIIPRCSVIKVLMVKGFIKEIENVSLFSVMCPVEKCFLEKFVARYIDEVPALLSVYQGKKICWRLEILLAYVVPWFKICELLSTWIGLFKLKAGRLGYSLFPKTKRYAVGFVDLNPSHFDSSLQSLILCRLLASEISEPQPNFAANYLVNSCGLSPEGAVSASKRVKLRSPERADSVMALLRNRGFSATQISKLVRLCPQLLVTNPEKTLLPKLEFFTSLGASKYDLAKIIASSPAVLSVSLQKRIKPTCHFLMNLLPKKNFVVFLKNGGTRILLEGHSKNVAPNIEILGELGMPRSCISLLLAHFPSSLTRNPENFGTVVDEVKQMGFDMEKSVSVSAIKALCSSNSKSIWSRNCEAYKRWGWSEDDVLSAFKRFPQCMTKSEKKIMQVMEFLVNKMGWPAGVINKYPIIVALSLEKRIIPRCSVVEVLISKGLIKEIQNVKLYSLLKPVEKSFLKRFVARYTDEVPQLLSVYQGRVKVEDLQNDSGSQCSPKVSSSYALTFPWPGRFHITYDGNECNNPAICTRNGQLGNVKKYL
ncbi:unnamed protein product [Malus baccata var. baccata]